MTGTALYTVSGTTRLNLNRYNFPGDGVRTEANYLYLVIEAFDLSYALNCIGPLGDGLVAVDAIHYVPVPQYTVSASAGPNGTVTPSSPQIVNSGGSLSFTASPEAGYAVNQWLVNSTLVQMAGNDYTLNNMTANKMVYVTFKPTVASPFDFNGDGKSDILWQNTATGKRSLWLMNGTTRTSSVSLGTVGTGWWIVGAGDFNGDGKSDILWRDFPGRVALWLTDGAIDIMSSGAFYTSWNIQGSADFNGDGKTDILWRDFPMGQRAIWLMDGSIHSSSVSLGAVSISWDIAGSGDFNGDGKSDILWQNDSTGQRAIWLMKGTVLR